MSINGELRNRQIHMTTVEKVEQNLSKGKNKKYFHIFASVCHC